jgi:hypothetical protein
MPETKTKKTKKDDQSVVVKYQQMVAFVKNIVHEVESDLKRARLVLSKLERFDPSDASTLDVDAQTEESIGSTQLQSYIDDDAQIVE